MWAVLAALLVACSDDAPQVAADAAATDAGVDVQLESSDDAPHIAPDTTAREADIDVGAEPGEGDAPAGCTCQMQDDPEIHPAGKVGDTSLACLCAARSGDCPASLDAALSRGTVTTYDCGLVEISFRAGAEFNPHRWIFDATTRKLVGILSDADVCNFACGTSTTCTVRAGTFPGTSCHTAPSRS